MSQDELDAIAREEQELTARLELMRARKLELEKIAKDNMSVTVTATSLQGGAVICAISPDVRDDILSVLRVTPGRWFNGINKTNTIPVEHWRNFVSNLEKLPNITLAYGNGTAGDIEAVLTAPRYSVSISEDKRQLAVKLGFRVLVNPLRIPGATYSNKHNLYFIPVSEGFRLWENLAKEEGTIWTKEAEELVLDDIERRGKLDSIALSEDAPEITVEFKATDVVLRPFQRVGIKFAEAAQGNLILADQMGLGKTIQYIAACMRRDKELNGTGRFAIVCPASLKINWLREIERLTGITPGVFSGETPGVRDLTRLVVAKSDKWCIFNYDILARKAETAVEMKDANGNTVRNNVVERYLWVDLINNSHFDRVAVDEAHYIKNTDSQRSKAVRMLTCKSITFMTGTPVLNRPGELWPMLTMIRPDQFPEEQAFLNRYTFNGKEARNVDELRQLLKGIMIRRLKKDVIKDLPALERIYDWHEMGEREWEVYNKVLQGVYIALDAWNPGQAGAEQAVPNILAQIMRLKQVCAISKLDRVSDLATELYDTHENGGASKVIIFSQFKPVARGVAKRLGSEAVWMTGDLNEHERQAVVDRFQNDPSVHFLCGTWQVMGEGRNLTAAGYVIFSDLFWTPANHQQCEERCYGRIGDMHGATSYYVVCKDTVEDWIQEILARKLRVINEVVEGIDSERTASMANELLTRMKQEMRRHR